jgi:hypothetical protein
MRIPSSDDLWKEVKGSQGVNTPEKNGADEAHHDNQFPEPDAAPAQDEEIDPIRLRSALAAIDPDADDDRTWLAYRVGPLANAAKARPDLEGVLFALAWEFSSGKLRGKPASTWTKKGTRHPARRHRLSELWQWLQKSKYSGRPVTHKTIYFHAIQQGWEEPSSADPAADAPKGANE